MTINNQHSTRKEGFPYGLCVFCRFFSLALPAATPINLSFWQAVKEVMTSCARFIEKSKIRKLCGIRNVWLSPNCVFQFRVSWVDDGATRAGTAHSASNTTNASSYKAWHALSPISQLVDFEVFWHLNKPSKTHLPLLPMGGKGGLRIGPQRQTAKSCAFATLMVNVPACWMWLKTALMCQQAIIGVCT